VYLFTITTCSKANLQKKIEKSQPDFALLENSEPWHLHEQNVFFMNVAIVLWARLLQTVWLVAWCSGGVVRRMNEVTLR